MQSRSDPADVIWSPDDPPEELPASDAVIALWGRTSGDAAELAANSDLALLSRKVALACGARSVLHFSSAAIYGPGVMMDEATPPHPVTEYGAAKLTMERVIAGFPPDENITHCCLRLANVVGADSLAPALNGLRPLVLDRFPDGQGPRRSYIGPGDLARVLTGLVMLPPASLPKVLNVTAPKPVSMEGLANAAGVPISWQDAPQAAVAEVTLDGDRLQQTLSGLRLNSTPSSIIKDMNNLKV